MSTFPAERVTAVEQWWCDHPDAYPGVWAYTDALSYRAGDTVRVRAFDSAEGSCRLTVIRDGARPIIVHDVTISCQAPVTNDAPWRNGCGWPVSVELTSDESWPAGGYIIELARLTDPSVRSEHWFAVLPQLVTADRIALIACTCTWTAYNGWGGANHYQGIDERGFSDGRSPDLSLRRPWSRGTVWLPAGAPRKGLTEEVPIGWMPRYPTLEWARAYGYPKNVASAGWATYEAPFVRWAEREGYTIDVLTQYDLERDPGILEPYVCAAIVGHDEYWSWAMRDTLDAWIDRGGRLARFAGNFKWQIRLENDATTQVCHKFNVAEDDPATTDPERVSLATTCWDDPLIRRPAALTMGSTGARGIYVRSFAAAPRSSGGYTVYRPRHWAFADCDLYYGDQLGAAANVFAYEVDGLDYTVTDGLPYATGADGIAPETVEILAMGLASMEEDHANRGTVLWGGRSELEYKAQLLYGDTSPQSLERASRGNGMMVEYQRGNGVVLNSGSCEWVNGLIRRDPFVEQITRNVLDRFLAFDRKRTDD
jgi:hypothetical protein